MDRKGMTPEMIRRRSFSSTMRGYKPAEVQQFLEQIADEMSELQQTCLRLERDAEMLEVKLRGCEMVDVQLNRLLERMTAAVAKGSDTEGERNLLRAEMEQERQRVLGQAREDAALIISEAEQKSRIFLMNANAQLKQIQTQIRAMQAERLSLLMRLRLLLKAQVEFLEALQNGEQETIPDQLAFSTYDARTGRLDTEQLELILKRLEELEGERK